MGRFYYIEVSGSRIWSSQANGSDNPGALNDPGGLDIAFDFFEYVFGPGGDAGYSTLTIHGVSLQDIQAASDFYGRQLTMKAGMSAGYQLSHPKQAGLIMQGQILQSFANWIGTDMTLDFVIIPSIFTQSNPGAFVFNWQPGTTLQDALQQTISTAYAKVTPKPQIVFQLSGNYAPIPSGNYGRYSTLRNLSAALTSFTKAASPSGTGVNVSYLNTGNTILVFDGIGTQATPLQIQFSELIGQPTWVKPFVMQFATPLRADISVGSYIKMPQIAYGPGTVTTGIASFSGSNGPGPSSPLALKMKSSFQGKFLVTAVRQLGSFRSPNGAEWSSIIECVAAP